MVATSSRSVPAVTDSPKPLSLAVLSGKGGSGKTLISVSLLRILHSNGPTLLVDADAGTGGLSYFLSLEYNRVQGTGLLGLILPSIDRGTSDIDSVSETYTLSSPTPTAVSQAPEDCLVTLDIGAVVRSLKGFEQGFVIPIGDIRRFIRTPLSVYQVRIGQVVDAVKALDYRFKIFDCRGGIDAFTLQICRHVDLILIVTETDVASVQSTENLLDVLRERNLDERVGGYCIS